jgi:large subunit ribosomal protein L1
MKKISKRFSFLKTQIKFLQYNYKDAIKLIKNLATAKFLESLEAHISLNIDTKYTNQQIRSTIILPHGTGLKKKIAVFTDNIKESILWGADIYGTDIIINQITEDKIDFNVLITTPQYMQKLLPFSKILGPKGLMPSLKSGTITNDIKSTLLEFKEGKLEYRADKSGIIHIVFGKSNFTEIKLNENLLAIFNSIEKNKPVGVKGKFFKSFYICTTMSPSINIDLTSFK